MCFQNNVNYWHHFSKISSSRVRMQQSGFYQDRRIECPTKIGEQSVLQRQENESGIKQSIRIAGAGAAAAAADPVLDDGVVLLVEVGSWLLIGRFGLSSLAEDEFEVLAAHEVQLGAVVEGIVQQLQGLQVLQGLNPVHVSDEVPRHPKCFQLHAVGEALDAFDPVVPQAELDQLCQLIEVLHLLDLVVGQVQLEQLLEFSEDGPDCLHIQPVQGQLFDGPKVAEGLEVRDAGLAEVKLNEVLEVKDAVNLFDGVVGQGEFMDFGQGIEKLHLLDEVLEQAALLQLLQLLYSLEAGKLVAGAANLSQIDQLGEGLQAADTVIVEADDSEVEEALDPFQRSETVVADVENFEVGEEAQEGKLFDVAEVEVELAEALGEALHEFGGKLPLDHVHLVSDLPELHADRVALVVGVVPEAVDVDELDQLLLEYVLLNLDLQDEDGPADLEVGDEGILLEDILEAVNLLLNDLGLLEELNVLDVDRVLHEVDKPDFGFIEVVPHILVGDCHLLCPFPQLADLEYDCILQDCLGAFLQKDLVIFY